jgi:hypothetical protein
MKGQLEVNYELSGNELKVNEKWIKTKLKIKYMDEYMKKSSNKLKMNSMALTYMVNT